MKPRAIKLSKTFNDELVCYECLGGKRRTEDDIAKLEIEEMDR